MVWAWNKLDPDAANKAHAVLDEFRRPNREIVLTIERADQLEKNIADALHDIRGVPKP